jgi:pyruvate/2-oxoglutarate dehydrogenase complex dihydrolipoamide acyltransferase (E2) component
MHDLTMPRLSDQMEEGTIVKWLVADGAAVAEGDELLEIETDKATVAHAAESSGVLRIVVGEGETVAVGEVIARVGVVGEDDEVPVEAEAEPAVAAPAAAPEPVAVGAVAGAASNGASNGNGVLATPLARRVARVHGIELGTLRGTGPNGRVTKADVLGAAGIEAPAPVAAPAPAPAPAAAAPAPAPSTPAAGATYREPTRLQALVARRMTEAKQTVPHFQVSTEVAMDDALALRAQLKATVPRRRSTTSSSRPAPARSATTRWSTAPSATAATSCTTTSTSAWRSTRPMASSSSRSAMRTPARSGSSPATPAAWPVRSARAASPRPTSRARRSPSPTSACSG